MRPRGWLAPLGALYGGAAALRAALYRFGVLPQARLAGPVISVGNLSVGGSGKTPVVARLAEILRDEGLPVAILSRGYGGAFRGAALLVSDGQQVLAGAAEAGDEPVMLARALPGVVVAVGPKRDVVGRAVEARFGPRVHLLDDGFQHLRLARDLDLVCLGEADLEDRPLPAGRLRELPQAVARADVVLCPGRRVVGFLTPEGEPRPAPARPFLLTGIARPERFEADVRGATGQVAGRRFFRDHHPFGASDLDAVLAEARAAGADAIVTTAKDAVRLPAWRPGLPVLVLRISPVLEDEESLRERLLAVARGARSRSRPRHALEDLAAAAVTWLVHLVPRRVALALGRGLGRWLGDLDRRHVAIAVDNLRRAFPHWGDARLLRTARGVYAHYGQTLLDILWLDGRSRDEILPLVEIEGGEHVRAALAARRGVILVTGHIGNWELHGLSHGWAFEPLDVVGRPLDNPALDRRLCRFRMISGNGVISKHNALARILRALRAGRAVALLIDQNVQEQDGIFVDFFGRPAATTTVAAALAIKTGCAIIPCRSQVLPDLRYRIVYAPPVHCPPPSDRRADIARLTQELTSRIEDWVRETPEQWLWIHRRWKTQPRAD